MALFQNKYRIESARWPGWDYSSGGFYFITICTKPRNCFFGRIDHKKIVLSDCGNIVDECWQSIPEHYKNVGLGVYAIMPDHFHGIIKISVGNGCDSRGRAGGCGRAGGRGGAGGRGVETGHAPSLHIHPETLPLLGNIVGSFKSAVTNKIHVAGIPGFGWQEKFYDRVIRDDEELRRIEQYILDNPKKWK